MTGLDFESDQFLQLLTDALRAGPGSPAWHEAVERISTQHGGQADEYNLLLEARRHLESGRSYRQIRAGPGFTRTVLAAVEREAACDEGRRICSPTVIAVLAILVGLGSLGFLVKYLAGGWSHQHDLPELQAQTFSQPVLTTVFSGQIPPGWQGIGPLTGDFHGEFRPPGGNVGVSYRGIGMVTTAPIPAGQPTEAVFTVRTGPPSDAVIVQVFVTDQPNFSRDRGTSPHELVWALQSQPDRPRASFRQQVVLPDGTFAPSSDTDLNSAAGAMATVRLAFNADFVLVDINGAQIYAGPHQLAADQPRYVGVRFLRRGMAMPSQLPSILNVRVSKRS